MPPGFMETKNGAGQLTEGLLVTAPRDPAPQCFLELRLYYLLPFSLGSRHLTLLTQHVLALRYFPFSLGAGNCPASDICAVKVHAHKRLTTFPNLLICAGPLLHFLLGTYTS